MDPLELARQLAKREGHLVIQQRKGEWTLGLGIRYRLEGEGENRMGDLRKGLDALDAIVDWTRDQGVPKDLKPRLLGGMQFQANAESWCQAFPSARFHLPMETWIIRPDGTYCIRADGEPLTDAALDGPTLPAATPMGHWSHMLQDAVETLRAGGLAKVVLARHAVATHRLQALAAFEGAYAQDPENKAFLDAPTPDLAFLGVTPETLVSMRGDHISTHALAGTTRRSGDADTDAALAEALMASSKDVLEHELVAAFLREQLAGLRVTNLTTEPRRVRTQRFVQHLETLVHGKANRDHHVFDLVSALHPTPAVCGTPREAARTFIREHEDFPRGWYAGAIGWVDLSGQGDFLVALRCALLQGTQAHLFAGAGILSQSDPLAEWEETERKLMPMRRALGDA